MELNMENYKHYVNLFYNNDNMDDSIHESEAQKIRQCGQEDINNYDIIVNIQKKYSFHSWKVLKFP